MPLFCIGASALNKRKHRQKGPQITSNILQLLLCKLEKIVKKTAINVKVVL
jgi:hypothetical protein